MRMLWGITLAVLMGLGLPGSAPAQSADQIKREIIRQSIARYPGRCPCPYHTARNGSSCGRRSAYSRAGGYAPLCYPEDVTEEMVAEHRKKLRR